MTSNYITEQLTTERSFFFQGTRKGERILKPHKRKRELLRSLHPFLTEQDFSPPHVYYVLYTIIELTEQRLFYLF